MPEKKIVPGEMEDIDVDYISLVKKGANKQEIAIYKEDSDQSEEEKEPVEKSFFEHMKAFFSKQDIEKAEKQVPVPSFASKMATEDVMNNLYRASDTFNGTIREIARSDIKDKQAAYANTIDEFSSYMKTKLSTKSIAKSDAFFDLQKEEEELNTEELQEIIKSTVEEVVKPLKEKIETIEKEEQPEEVSKSEKEKMDAEEMAASIKDIVKEAVGGTLEDMEKRLSGIEKSRGIAKSDEAEDPKVIEKEADIFDGYFVAE